jgi:lipopolysaccharide biosynthesis regulator YciM
MQQQVIDELNNAAGRRLAENELQGLRDRAEAAFHDLEAEDPIAWRAMPIGERISRAAELAHMRHKAAVLTQQRRQIARALSAHPDVARAHITSSAVLNGYVSADVL